LDVDTTIVSGMEQSVAGVIAGASTLEELLLLPPAAAAVATTLTLVLHPRNATSSNKIDIQPAADDITKPMTTFPLKHPNPSPFQKTSTTKKLCSQKTQINCKLTSSENKEPQKLISNSPTEISTKEGGGEKKTKN
jgi:hypothetical protein